MAVPYQIFRTNFVGAAENICVLSPIHRRCRFHGASRSWDVLGYKDVAPTEQKIPLRPLRPSAQSFFGVSCFSQPVPHRTARSQSS